ncbi:MAG: hypothetical protein ACOY3P_21725 [Planctomycetota bacterium]
MIPFDFVSKFDNGRYGEMVGDMMWKKLSKEPDFIVPESMLDVRDTCKANKSFPTPEMPLDEVKRIVQEEFGAHIGIWGSIERLPNVRWDEYDLVIKCVDFAAGLEPKVVYEVRTQTKTVSEIPHLYAKQMLEALVGTTPSGGGGLEAIIEANWQKNPNVVTGDFQSGAGGAPKGWEAVAGQQREPLGKQAAWVAEGGNAQNRIIRFTMNEALGNSTGVMYYSDMFPIDAGATYRIEFRWRTTGPTPLVFVKCYDSLQSEYQAGVPKTSVARTRNDYIPTMAQVREVYRCQCNPKGDENAWHTHSQDFTPKHTRYTPRWGRVMLYAFHGAGAVEWDDVVLKQVLPASPGELNQNKRHSIETKVTDAEIEENRRRSREAQQRAK